MSIINGPSVCETILTQYPRPIYEYECAFRNQESLKRNGQLKIPKIKKNNRNPLNTALNKKIHGANSLIYMIY